MALIVASVVAVLLFVFETRRDAAFLQQAREFEDERAALTRELEDQRAMRAERLENQRFVRVAASSADPERLPSFRRIDVCESTLAGLNLSGADFRWANLSGVDFYFADLRNADLGHSNLTAADLRRADLRGANLTGAVVRGARLSGADLRDTSFFGSTLAGTSLEGADLTGSDLTAANLTGTYMSRANLDGVDLAVVYWDESDPPVWPEGLEAPPNSWSRPPILFDDTEVAPRECVDAIERTGVVSGPMTAPSLADE